MRNIGADGWNSFWHFTFGALSVFYWWIIPLFFMYQFQDPYEKNIKIDLAEFCIGFIVVYLLQQYSFSTKSILIPF